MPFKPVFFRLACHRLSCSDLSYFNFRSPIVNIVDEEYFLVMCEAEQLKFIQTILFGLFIGKFVFFTEQGMGTKRPAEEDYNSNVHAKRSRDEDGGNMKQLTLRFLLQSRVRLLTFL